MTNRSRSESFWGFHVVFLEQSDTHLAIVYGNFHTPQCESR